MNACPARPWEPTYTTGPGAPHDGLPLPTDVALGTWPFRGTSQSAALDEEGLDCFFLFAPGTTGGGRRLNRPPPSQQGVAELRRKTNLTWAQLARALGVRRRSLHFWARGEPPTAANLERLMRMVAVVHLLDTGDPMTTTGALLQARGGEPSPFDMLCEGRDGELLAALERRRPARPTPARAPRRPLPPLSREERAWRRGGISPVDRLALLHDDEAPPDLGPLVFSIPIPKSRD